MGGHTASLLLGARLSDLQDGTVVDLSEPRITAGVLLAAPGRGDALTDFAAEHYGFLSTTDFTGMSTPTLVVVGDNDVSSHLTVAGPGWFSDPYHLAPGAQVLVTLFGAEHGLGGVSGYDAAETTDEDPQRVALVQSLTGAWLRHALGLDESGWPAERAMLEGADDPLGRVESK